VATIIPIFLIRLRRDHQVTSKHPNPFMARNSVLQKKVVYPRRRRFRGVSSSDSQPQQAPKSYKNIHRFLGVFPLGSNFTPNTTWNASNTPSKEALELPPEFVSA